MLLIVMILVMLVPATATSKSDKGRGGGDTTAGILIDYGDVFGDLIHVLRTDTGQPILAQRWVEMPAELPGFGWGYCSIAIDEQGAEIPFLPYSCDLDTSNADVVEVDYFGRLNGSRVQERNLRMHLNEAIINIKQSGQLQLDPVGRLMLGSGCELDDPAIACLWSTVDSPMENMALYRRLMKYGHLSTNPEELDLWWHGDPKLPVPYHPALDSNDFAKFIKAGLDHMLPSGMFCWDGTTYVASCAEPEFLTAEDFVSTAAFLGGAAGKGGLITDHLVQYLNRFLNITQTTEFAASTLSTLPAIVRDCWPEGEADPWVSGEEPPADVVLTVDLVYGECTEFDVVVDEDDGPNIPNYYDFTNVQELFVNFGPSGYGRDDVWGTISNPTKTANLALEFDPFDVASTWSYNPSVPLIEWILIPNPATPAAADIQNFVDAASDVLRAVEFIHNYAVPENLFCKYDPETYCPTE